MIIDVVLWCVLLVNMLMFHEFGHYVYADYAGLKPEIKIDKKVIGAKTVINGEPNNRQIRTICLWGVIFGFIPVLLSFMVFGYLLGFLTLGLYIMGVKSDLRKILYKVW